MSKVIEIVPGPDGFAEDKDQARHLRAEEILPALKRQESLVLDFARVRYATQSYVHVLIGEALRRYGERVLDLLEFKNCSPNLRSVIELVVNYSLEGFPEQQAV